jgi:hypothetical protein
LAQINSLLVGLLLGAAMGAALQCILYVLSPLCGQLCGTASACRALQPDALHPPVAVCRFAALLVWFIALLLPFFGVINDILGAFAVTFET